MSTCSITASTYACDDKGIGGAYNTLYFAKHNPGLIHAYDSADPYRLDTASILTYSQGAWSALPVQFDSIQLEGSGSYEAGIFYEQSLTFKVNSYYAAKRNLHSILREGSRWVFVVEGKEEVKIVGLQTGARITGADYAQGTREEASEVEYQAVARSMRPIHLLDKTYFRENIATIDPPISARTTTEVSNLTTEETSELAAVPRQIR